MADKTPIRYAYDGSSLTGIAEYATSDTVGIAFGGTGATSLTDNGILIGNATSAIQVTSALTTNGQIVIGGTSGPAVANISGTSNEVEITNADGTITIGLPSALCSTGTLEIGGNVSFDGGTFVFNDAGADKDFRIEGDTDANLFIADASTDRIGIGTATPSHLLDVDGVAHVATCLVTPKLCITSQYVLPAADGSAGQILCTDGSGATQFAAAASSGHTIADEGSALASRTCLNFIGTAVAATDNSGTDATDVTICATNAFLPVREADGTACCVTLATAAVGESLVSDTSPQLGGDLDVNGNSIVSDASNENIPITPHGTGSVVISKISVTGDSSLDGGTFVFNESGADKDFRVEGDTDANLFISDASTDRIGIGTATPSHLLDVDGVANVATCIITPKICIYPGGFSSGYVLPAADGSAGQLMCTDGSGALAFATAPSSGISFNGSTANGVATYASSSVADVEANLTFASPVLTIGPSATAELKILGSGNNSVKGLSIYTAASPTEMFDLGVNYGGGAIEYDAKTGMGQAFQIDGTTELLITAAGSIGIGTTNPNANPPTDSSSARVLYVDGGEGVDAALQIVGHDYNHGMDLWTDVSTGCAYFDQRGNHDNYAFQFRTKTTGTPINAMQIRGNGLVMIGKTTSNWQTTGIELGTSANQFTISDNPVMQIIRTGASGTAIAFYDGTTGVGSIAVTSSSTAYNTSSDYRLKENIIDMTGAVDRVAQLQPHRFNFIADADKTVDGFVAHEVSDIVPEAITGAKDETRGVENVILYADGAILAEGKTEEEWVTGKEDETYAADTVWHETLTVPEYQGIDQAKLVPLLTAAIQELTARIEALESA